MTRDYYLKLFPVMLVIVVLTVSCGRRVILGVPTSGSDDPPANNDDPPAEVMVPAQGYDTSGFENIFHGDYAPPHPSDGFTTLANAVKYPESTRSEGIEGVVILSFQVLPDGTVRDVTSLENNIDFRLLGASIDAILSVKWSPAVQNGVAVDSYITVPIRFILDN